MSNQALTDLIQRFAVSALSKERKDEAVNEEILVGKYTGEFFIKTKDGVVISTDVLNRLKASTDAAIRAAENTGIAGNLFHIDFDNLALPAHVDYSTNIVEEEPIELPANIKKVLLNIDFDEYDIIQDTAKPVHTEAIVDINIQVTLGDGTVNNMVFNQPIDKLNSFIMDLGELVGVTSIIINSIFINQDLAVYNTGYSARAIILHNLFVTVI